MLSTLLLGVAACASTTAPARPAHFVSATVLANGCTNLGPANGKLAQKAMLQLTDGCSSFSGGSVRFTATLLPGGAIQFEPRADQSDSIPICVLSHPLTHEVHLKKSCSLDVQLEEKSMALPKAGDPKPGETGPK
jgi:hypothetical protein